MKLGRNDPCWCGSGKKYKKCHEDMDKRLKVLQLKGHIIPDHSLIKTEEQIQGIRDSAKINIAVLDEVAKQIHEGMSTQDIDDIVYNKTVEMGGIPAPLNYEGFPKSVCTSINSQVCHGIPDKDIILKDGDIINVDCSTIYHGYFSDSSRMFCIGNVSEEDRKLVEFTRDIIHQSLQEVKPYECIGNIGAFINENAKKQGYSVVEEVGGHGCGIEFHEEPFVSFVSKRDTDMVMAPGMVFTIEPMINAGKHDVYLDASNEWTIYTRDGSSSAQWELQVLVTETGYEIISY